MNINRNAIVWVHEKHSSEGILYGAQVCHDDAIFGIRSIDEEIGTSVGIIHTARGTAWTCTENTRWCWKPIRACASCWVS